MKRFSKLSEIELNSENRDKVGSSPSVLQKNSSEGKKEEYRDVDLITSLHILKVNLMVLTQLAMEHVPNTFKEYVHSLSM